MSPTSDHLSLARDLRRQCTGDVLVEPAEIERFAHDFGGVARSVPALVVRPASEADVTVALRAAVDAELPVSVRGAGHGQSGQCLGSGLVLDMTGLDGVQPLDAGERLISVQAGATWRQVVDATFGCGLLPLGLPQALDPTVAGTLCVGGVGAETFRTGPQVDNVSFLDVALVGGDVVRCSAESRRDLFDAVRAGVGQCAVILRAGYRLRPCLPMLHVDGFVYSDPERYLADALSIAAPEAKGRWLTTLVIRHPFRPGRRCLVLLVGQEYGPDAAPSPVVAEHCDVALPSRSFPLWRASGLPGHPFFRVFGASESARSGEINPWVEHLFSVDMAAAALEAVLTRSEPVLSQGPAGVILVRRGAAAAPLFAVPDGALSVGIGAFATFEVARRNEALALMQAHAERMGAFNGKRYLSGWLGFDRVEQWAAHFGAAWDAFRSMKGRCDARQLLNPGVIRWQ